MTGSTAPETPANRYRNQVRNPVPRMAFRSETLSAASCRPHRAVQLKKTSQLYKSMNRRIVSVCRYIAFALADKDLTFYEKIKRDYLELARFEKPDKLSDDEWCLLANDFNQLNSMFADLLGLVNQPKPPTKPVIVTPKVEDPFDIRDDVVLAKLPAPLTPTVVPPKAAVPVKPPARSKGPDRPLPRPAVQKPDFVVIQIEPDPVPEEPTVPSDPIKADVTTTAVVPEFPIEPTQVDVAVATTEPETIPE